MDTTAILVGLGIVLGLVAWATGAWAGRRKVRAATEDAERLLHDARLDADNKQKEILVAAREKALALEEGLDAREQDLEAREGRLDQRKAKLDREASEQGQQRKKIADLERSVEKTHAAAAEALAIAEKEREEARSTLERIAGMTESDARAELIAEVESEARTEATRIARKIEDEAREQADRAALNLIIQATQRINLSDAAESTVSFIELPSDEMKGRIIGKEGRNIRALEMATGIDLVVDDTPRTILISSFDPVRREIARVAIGRLVEDGRIHPARIEEVVQKAREEIDSMIEARGTETAFELGISDLNPRLTRLIGRMRYHTHHGQNLLQHCLETAWIASHMAAEVGARADVALRAGLLHEVGRVDETAAGASAHASAELCARFGESDDVVHAVRSLHAEISPHSIEALLLGTANKLSESRPGARKENLSVFIERLRRLEGIATSYAGVKQAYAVKAGKELRVILDSNHAKDENVYGLSKQIARALERELNYPGQVKVCVVRETRSVRYAV
jgi:ribonuclease Y